MNPTGIGWVDFLIALAAAASALEVLRRKVLRPAWRLVRSAYRALQIIERVAPILIAIAGQFTSNGGSTLKDALDRIESNQAESNRQFDELHEYSHHWRHDISNELTKRALADAALARKVDRLIAATGAGA